MWSDYLCPWCYLGLDREQQLEDLGLAVVIRPYELHREIPIGGREIRDDGRTAHGLRPRRSRVRGGRPAVSPPATLAEHAVPCSPPPSTCAARSRTSSRPCTGRCSPPTSPRDATSATRPSSTRSSPRAAVTPRRRREPRSTSGAAQTPPCDASMAEAWDHEVTGTPAFLLPSGFVIPGVQDRETMADRDRVRAVLRLGETARKRGSRTTRARTAARRCAATGRVRER